MSDTTTTTAQASSPAPAQQPSSGLRLRLPGTGGGNPLFRNAYALMLNTGISALLGLSFWLAAARYYSESAVGQGSAAIAAMKLLAGLTALTLTGALARFIPVAGRRTGRLVLRTYAGSSVVVAVAALVFLSTLSLWGPSYSFLHGPLNGLGFVLAVVAWSLLTLQDGVLTGLRSALWVPVGNTVFSAVKLVLLIVIAASIPTAGVFVSWVAAIAVSVIPLGWLVFRRLVPRHVAATEDRAQPPTLRQMGRFLAGDYTGSLFSLAVVYAVPVIVASQVSSEDNAYFYITTTIGGTVNLLAINMGASLTVEGAHDPSTLAQNCRAALRRMARIMLPVAAALFFGAPYILGVFGEGYADAATPLLRWFAVGALLRVVIEVYFAVLRAQSRTSPLAYLQGGLCVLVLGLTLLLLPRMGLVGAGIAEISSLAVVASVAGVMLYRVVRSAPPARSKGAEAAAPDGDLADLAVDGDRGDSADSLSEERPPGGEFGTRWALRSALDAPTMPLGARLDFDHPERRPDVRPGPETPAAGTPAAGSGGTGDGDDHRPTWALKSPVPRMIPSPRSASSVPAATPSAEASEKRGEERVEQVASASRADDVPPAPRRTPLRPRVPELGVGLLLLAALALYWLPVRGIGEAGLERIGGLGLISVLPAATLLGAGMLALSFASLLWLDRPRTVLLTVALVATVVSLHALPAVLEAEPRFPTAWQHLGFMDYIDRTGTAVPDLDARWSWPGFFALATFVAEACGVEDMSSVIRWWPPAMQLLYLPPLFLLVRSMRASWRAKWAGAWIFVLSGWVGQDYFSPQGFTYGMYMAFVAIVLVWFREPRVLWRKRRPGEAEVRPAGRSEKAVLLLVVVGLFAATVPAHQLTPFVMLGVLAVLVMTGRSTLRGLPMLFAVLVAVWIGFFAEPYWSGHFDELFGGMGGVGGNVTSSVSGRIEGGSSTHKLVLYVRVAMAGGVMAFACWGWWRRRFAGYSERSLLVLAFVPFLGFGMQSYGGEMALRVFMFALPGAALLAGLALFPRTGVTVAEREADRKSLAPLAALLTGLILMGGFLVSRWGNESFERTRAGEVAAMEFVYAHDDPSVRLLWMSSDTIDNVTPAIPWGARDMEKVSYVPTLAPVDPVLVAGLVKSLKDAGPNSYLMINRSQSTYLRLDAGYSPTWEKRLTANLDRRPELKKVLSNADVSLYALREQPDGPVAKPDPGPAGPKITWTPWSVVGALAALALIVLLAAREVVRVAVAPGVRQLQWLQSTFWFSLPLLAVLLASLVQRFLTMS
ncbi:lipopolysaccharide biosynthesis protein [Streptomyces sp. ISL-100]|uniref:lipopolysaccharide biosynthesis protein n=1 Tax=Streptomyces sp. ISL-100 TaxID=2819173 RepID=UPI001BE9C6FF|nr:polysaccharide biosynthesis C-terminal domain-containing protein [Streptomyces sp. ISL-100]MBT2399657.1 polysaccharide biosynthesis C-terminal domain-containing protein [Streptomyces sp. ISL-100]